MRIRTLRAGFLLGCSVLFTSLSAQNSGISQTCHTKVETTPTRCGAIGDGTATVEILTQNPSAPYEFVLNPGNKKLVSFNTVGAFSGLGIGDYTVTATDADGNEMEPVSFSITNTGLLDLNFVAVNTSCVGAANGKISIEPPAGTAPITYSINGGNYNTQNIFSGLGTGTYLVSAKDAAGCEAKEVPVKIDPGPSISLATISTPTTCSGIDNGSIIVSVSNGTAPFNYSLNGKGFQPSPVFSNLAAGAYSVSIQDAIGCVVNTTQTVVRGNVTITGTVSISESDMSGDNKDNITVTPTSGTGSFDFSINNGIDWQSSNIFKDITPGSYSILIRQDKMCISNKISVTVPSAIRSGLAPGFYLANAFTPDNDGRNDEFIPVAVGIKQLNYFRVFNRAGQMIFSTTALSKGWDGKMTGKEQVGGVYVWVLQGITEKGVTINKQGTVMLIR